MTNVIRIGSYKTEMTNVDTVVSSYNIVYGNIVGWSITFLPVVTCSKNNDVGTNRYIYIWTNWTITLQIIIYLNSEVDDLKYKYL